ncbi:MAG: tetratricopeptide repeat protein [Methylophilales bacterium]|nr:tetratricopeptide repeat protein [Methylophilales bacterium]
MNTRNSQVDPNILFQQAFQFQQNGRLQDAELMYKNLLQISPSHLGAKTMLGMIFVQSERDIEGIRFLKSSLISDPKQFWAHNALGVGLLNTKQYQEAIFSFNKALILKPDYTDAYFNLGKTQRALRQYKNAIISYSKCIDLDKCYASAYNNSGTIYLEDLKEYEKSVSKFQQFLTLVPDSSPGLYNLGTALKELKRYDEALQNLNKAIQLKPDYAEAYLNRGVIFKELKRYHDALVSYDRAIQLKSDYAEAYSNRGVTYNELKCYDDALVSYDRAIQLKPDMDYLLGNVIHTKMHLCDWLNLDILVNQLTEKIIKHQVATIPFITLALIDDPELQKQSAETYINDKYPTSNALPKIRKYLKQQKIHIGYFSADFHNHATMHLMADLFEYHDKSKFELIAFSFGPDQQDEWRQKAISSFDQFIDVRSKSDIEVASLARELKIDIAVDLKGFTQDARVGIFAHRAAPIQVNYLGYPGTMGAEYIDYIIADPILIPEDKQQYYMEKIVYLPNSYQVNVKEKLISDKALSRKEVGLPDNAFVFCSFNNNYKITPKTFDCWLRILQAVEGSVLWVFNSNETAVENLKKEAELRGIDSSCLVFASLMPVEEHLKRIQLADLFLDTLPCNAHTTASDALRVGLPVITLMGESFASRVAASLLNAVGLPELITTTPKVYESLAIELATKPKYLREIKDKLFTNLPASPLYNTKLFTQDIETAYQEMYQCYQAELAPDHIYVKN